VHGPGDLLVEQRVSRESRDGVVEAEGHFSQIPRAAVEIQHRLEKGLAMASMRLDHFTVPQG
jgi:hypothetical protein